MAGLALGVNTGAVCVPRAWQSLPSISMAPCFAKSSLRKLVPGTRATMMSPAPDSPTSDLTGAAMPQGHALVRACAVCLATALAVALPLLPLPAGVAVEVAPSEPPTTTTTTTTTLVEAPTPAKDVGTLLRDALPLHNAAIRDVQKSLEGIAECLKLPPEDAISSVALNTRKAALVLDQSKESILAEIMDQKRVMGQLLVDELSVGVTECNKLAEDENLAPVAAKQKDLLQIVSKLEEFMVNKFPFEVPEEYATKPLLKGRATIEMKVRLKERSTSNGTGTGNGNGNGSGKSTVVRIVVDGYNAPLTAGNFVDLVARRFYDGMAIQKADGFIVQTGDPPGSADGFVDPGTGKVRTIPLEIMVEGDNAPIYGATLEELGRDQDKTKLPFNSCSTLAMARKDRDKNSASSQIFWLLRDCQEKVNFEEPHAAPEASDDASQESAAKAVELQVKDPAEGYSSAIELNTTDPSVEDKKETVTKEVNITKSILDGVAAEDEAAAAPGGGAAGDQEQAGQVRGTGVESGDLQESEVIKVDDLKRSNGTTKDGQYAVFGYVVENQELLGQLQVGDVIENMRVISGIDNLVNPSYRI